MKRNRLFDIISFNTPQAIVFNLTAILVILTALPTGRLHYLPVRSVYEGMFGFTPYSSGMTRALSRFLHGDVMGAWGYNKLAFVVFLIMLILIMVNLFRSAKNNR